MATATISTLPTKAKVKAALAKIQPNRSLVPAATITVESVAKPGKTLSLLTLGQRRLPPTMRALQRACGKAPFLVRAF